MQFRLSTMLPAFVVVAAALGLFGGWGIVVAVVLLAVTAYFRRRKVFWSYALGMPLIAIVALLFATLSATLDGVLEHGRYTCQYRLERLGRALQGYQQANGNYPPAYVACKDGKAMHSWRVLLLPYP